MSRTPWPRAIGRAAVPPGLRVAPPPPLTARRAPGQALDPVTRWRLQAAPVADEVPDDGLLMSVLDGLRRH